MREGAGRAGGRAGGWAVEEKVRGVKACGRVGGREGEKC